MKSFKKVLFIWLVLAACGEKLIEKPENLIPKDKMVMILQEMALINAAKGVNLGILKDNGVEPTTYVFEKFGIDSAQFVISDRYYASLPTEYEAIYTEVEASLEAKRIALEQEKKITDSLKLLENKRSKEGVLDSLKTKPAAVKDSLP
ncbi:DUF4296 domain-containing protein [Maribacter aurantiacus]|uniref:DUF4296 domain-containing protein n=1 Tax=Maribacter aurantiacus TaxID=1882343 RepID=A0A5R8MBB2_9FLAO|nr:DUF4296 domain-containing protein [Maribacter aurantiacus]TLF46815.1 DUF4296 domain-containing protein [Maribacter aurantiacus]